MKKAIKFNILVSLWLAATNIYADIHTWHEITTQSSSKWHGRLTMLSANQGGYFSDNNGTTRGGVYDFSLSAITPIRYGFGFTPQNTDFNVAYSLSIYESDTKLSRHFSSKACVYVITAASPAKPDLRISEFNGAKCTIYKKKGGSMNFLVA